MNAQAWIPLNSNDLLDVGCNIGAGLVNCSTRFPRLKLAGIEINESALKVAKQNLPQADLQIADATNIPFPDKSFDVVTCIEVIEHVPASDREKAFSEIWRVLRPGGRLILTTPHQGWFAWLDSNNIRFLWPKVYRAFVRQGNRDSVYEAIGHNVEWHQHFTKEDLLSTAGKGWNEVAVERAGLFLYPMMDWLSWPFYRWGQAQHPIRKMFEAIAGWDYSIDYGGASYGIMLVLQRAE